MYFHVIHIIHHNFIHWTSLLHFLICHCIINSTHPIVLKSSTDIIINIVFIFRCKVINALKNVIQTGGILNCSSSWNIFFVKEMMQFLIYLQFNRFINPFCIFLICDFRPCNIFFSFCRFIFYFCFQCNSPACIKSLLRISSNVGVCFPHF